MKHIESDWEATEMRTPARRWAPAGRVVVAVIAVVVWTMGAAGVASAEIANPLSGIAPDFGLFGDALNTAWKRVVAAIWAAVIIGATVRVIIGAYKVRRAKNRGYAGDLSEGMEDLQDAFVSLGLAGLASPIVAAVLFVVGG